MVLCEGMHGFVYVCVSCTAGWTGVVTKVLLFLRLPASSLKLVKDIIPLLLYQKM